MHKTFGKDRACGSGDIVATDRQADTQTDILITMLHNCSCRQSYESNRID